MNKAFSASKLSIGFHNAITKYKQSGSISAKKPPKKIYKLPLDGPEGRGYNRGNRKGARVNTEEWQMRRHFRWDKKYLHWGITGRSNDLSAQNVLILITSPPENSRGLPIISERSK